MTTKQLQLAIDRATHLPADRQDALAAVMLEEISSEARWDEQFHASADKLAALADEALAEDARGETRPLDESIG
jgi:hypothetical protein